MNTDDIQKRMPEGCYIEISKESIVAHNNVFGRGICCNSLEQALQICKLAAKIENIHSENGGY